MGDTTRDRLLEAGWSLLSTNRGDIGAVRMQAVVDAADVTSGAFYSNWGDLAEFQRDLLRYGFTQARSAHSEKIRGSIMGDLIGPNGPQIPLSELVHRYAREDREALASDPSFRLWVALWARHAADVDVVELIRAGYAEIDARWSELYRHLLRAYGRKLRKPFTERDLSVMLTALLEGLVLRGAVDSTVAEVTNGREVRESDRWDLFSTMILALLPLITQPADDLDDRDIWSIARVSLGEGDAAA